METHGLIEFKSPFVKFPHIQLHPAEALLPRFLPAKDNQRRGNALAAKGGVNPKFSHLVKAPGVAIGGFRAADVFHHGKAADGFALYGDNYIGIFGFKMVVQTLLHRVTEVIPENVWAAMGVEVVDLLPQNIYLGQVRKCCIADFKIHCGFSLLCDYDFLRFLQTSKKR